MVSTQQKTKSFAHFPGFNGVGVVLASTAIGQVTICSASGVMTNSMKPTWHITTSHIPCLHGCCNSSKMIKYLYIYIYLLIKMGNLPQIQVQMKTCSNSTYQLLYGKSSKLRMRLARSGEGWMLILTCGS